MKFICGYIGRCKGYGFVEYAHNHEKSELARQQLDGMRISGSVLGCQFVPSSLVHYTDLHSRCLLVTNIPRDVSTTATLCQVFSVVSVPVFCQVWHFYDCYQTFLKLAALKQIIKVVNNGVNFCNETSHNVQNIVIFTVYICCLYSFSVELWLFYLSFCFYGWSCSTVWHLRCKQIFLSLSARFPTFLTIF